MHSTSTGLRQNTSVSVLALMTAFGGLAGTAFAQDTQTMETVVVTGTGTNITGVAPVGSESIKMDRQQIQATGLPTLTDVVNTLPQVQQVQNVGRLGGTAQYGGYGGFGANTSQGTSISLRSTGNLATLFLVDGRRVAPSGAAQTFTQGNNLSLAAIDRIEVVADGSSGIYGSDAVAGVVNIITRKDFEGVEVTGRYTTQHGTQSYEGSVTGGLIWDHPLGTSLGEGNVLVTYDYSHSDPMLYSASRFLKQDLSGISYKANGTAYHGRNGTDPTAGAGTPYPGPSGYMNYQANAFAGAVYYAVPNGPNAALTSAAFTPNTWNTVARDNYADYLPDTTSHQVSGYFNQELTPWLTVYYQGFYTHRESLNRLYENGSPSVVFSNLSPYYPTGGIPGVAAGWGFGFPGVPIFPAYSGNNGLYEGHYPVRLYYNTYKDVGPVVANTPDDAATNIIGFKMKLPNDWNGDVYITNSVDHSCGICNFGNNLDVDALQHAVDTGQINPLSNAPLTAAQKALVYGTNLQYGRNIMDDARFKFDGPLGSMPGGEIKVAIGAEYTYLSEGITNGANRSHGPNGTYNGESDYAAVRTVPSYNAFAIDNQAKIMRRIISGFGEIYVPIIGDANALPFVKSFNLDAAIRYDHYSDFGNTTNPKLGATWEVDDQLKVQASIGTSFQAPALTQVNPYTYSSHGTFQAPNGTGDTAIPQSCSGTNCQTTWFYLVGNPSKLQPQKANTWSVGFDYSPHWLDGFKVGASYFDLRYKDQINSPLVFNAFSNPAVYAIYKTYIHPVHQPAGCHEGDPSTYDPALLPYITAVAIYGSTSGQVCNIQAVLDGRITNLASTQSDYVDFNTSYDYDTGSWGSLSFNGSMSVTLHNNTQPVKGAAITDNLGTIYNPVRFRGRASLGWFLESWNANLFMNYVGSYKNNATPTVGGVQYPQYWVPAWITFDAGVGYKFQDAVWSGFNGTRLSLSASNVFNQAPPVVLTSNSAMDPQNANPYGRMLTISLTKDF